MNLKMDLILLSGYSCGLVEYQSYLRCLEKNPRVEYFRDHEEF
jgi:hypothetical protein